MNNTSRFSTATLNLKARERISVHAGDNSVINNALLPRMPNPFCVIITENVYNVLDVVGDVTNTDGFEIPFVLTGYFDKENKQVIIDDGLVQHNSESGRLEAIATHELEKYATDFVRSAKTAENKVIAFGHTHPQVGNYYLNFSWGDVSGYIDTHEQNRDFFNNHNLSMLACLLTGGNFNFLFCNNEDTYRFDNVFVQRNNGDLEKLPAFGPDVVNINNRYNGNIGR